jgi:hypothetical protein
VRLASTKRQLLFIIAPARFMQHARMRASRAWVVMCCLAACGGGGGGNSMGDDDGPMPDAKVFMDAPPVVPQTFMISGTVTERGLNGTSPVAGVTVAAFASSNASTAVGMATTDAQGLFALTVMTNGMPLDGYLLATKSGYVDLYMYPTSPFIKNYTDADLNMITPGNKDFLSSLASGNQMAGKGLIGLAVLDMAGMPVAGATVSSTPAAGAYRYTGSNGLPSGSATTTSADGVAFMFNMPSGPITISATKSGMTFKSHVVTAPADKMTTTAITP